MNCNNIKKSAINYIPLKKYKDIVTTITAVAERHLRIYAERNKLNITGDVVRIVNKGLKMLSDVDDFFVCMHKINKTLKVTEIGVRDDNVMFTMAYQNKDGILYQVCFQTLFPDVSYIQDVKSVKIIGYDLALANHRCLQCKAGLIKQIERQTHHDFSNIYRICAEMFNLTK